MPDVLIKRGTICPQCCGRKSVAAAVCRGCYIINQEEECLNRPLKPRKPQMVYDTCECGNQKDSRAKRCRECWSTHQDNPFWNHSPRNKKGYYVPIYR